MREARDQFQSNLFTDFHRFLVFCPSSHFVNSVWWKSLLVACMTTVVGKGLKHLWEELGRRIKVTPSSCQPRSAAWVPCQQRWSHTLLARISIKHCSCDFHIWGWGRLYSSWFVIAGSTEMKFSVHTLRLFDEIILEIEKVPFSIFSLTCLWKSGPKMFLKGYMYAEILHRFFFSCK